MIQISRGCANFWAFRQLRLAALTVQTRALPVLRSMETLDLEACPGSGKTTLLVAKLAILARKWTERRRGFCVLSHTNGCAPGNRNPSWQYSRRTAPARLSAFYRDHS